MLKQSNFLITTDFLYFHSVFMLLHQQSFFLYFKYFRTFFFSLLLPGGPCSFYPIFNVMFPWAQCDCFIPFFCIVFGKKMKTKNEIKKCWADTCISIREFQMWLTYTLFSSVVHTLGNDVRRGKGKLSYSMSLMRRRSTAGQSLREWWWQCQWCWSVPRVGDWGKAPFHTIHIFLCSV